MSDPNDPNDPQPAPVGDGEPVWPMVVRDMVRRDEVGRTKYSRPLTTFNGRDALVDAYQEILDLAVYVRQELHERELAKRDAEHLPEVVRRGQAFLHAVAHDERVVVHATGTLHPEEATALLRLLTASIEMDRRLQDQARARACAEVALVKAEVQAAAERETSLDGIAKRIARWQARTFLNPTLRGALAHMAREVDEATEIVNQPMGASEGAEIAEELADVFHLLVQCFTLLGHDMPRAILDKLALNQGRAWQAPDAEGVVEHAR